LGLGIGSFLVVGAGVGVIGFGPQPLVSMDAMATVSNRAAATRQARSKGKSKDCFTLFASKKVAFDPTDKPVNRFDDVVIEPDEHCLNHRSSLHCYAATVSAFDVNVNVHDPFPFMMLTNMPLRAPTAV
jgi:hypothetical protein